LVELGSSGSGSFRYLDLVNWLFRRLIPVASNHSPHPRLHWAKYKKYNKYNKYINKM
jgi:hypothetical protein